MLPTETQARIAELRSKAAAGSLTLDDMREAIALLRQGRVSAAASSDAARRKKAKAVIPDAASLLNELEGL